MIPRYSQSVSPVSEIIPCIPLSLSFFSFWWVLGRGPSLQLLLSPVLYVIFLQISKLSLGLKQEKLKRHERNYYILIRARKKGEIFVIFTLKWKCFGSWFNFCQGSVHMEKVLATVLFSALRLKYLVRGLQSGQGFVFKRLYFRASGAKCCTTHC